MPPGTLLRVHCRLLPQISKKIYASRHKACFNTALISSLSPLSGLLLSNTQTHPAAPEQRPSTGFLPPFPNSSSDLKDRPLDLHYTPSLQSRFPKLLAQQHRTNPSPPILRSKRRTCPRDRVLRWVSRCIGHRCAVLSFRDGR